MLINLGSQFSRVALWFSLCPKGVNLSAAYRSEHSRTMASPPQSPHPSSLTRLPGSEGFLNPALEGGSFLWQKERAVEFPLRQAGYAKCKEEEEEGEEAAKRMSQRRKAAGLG